MSVTSSAALQVLLEAAKARALPSASAAVASSAHVSFAAVSRRLTPSLSKQDAVLLARALLANQHQQQRQHMQGVSMTGSSARSASDVGAGAATTTTRDGRAQALQQGRRMVGMLLRSTSDWDTAMQLERFKARHSTAHAQGGTSRATLRRDWHERAHCLRLSLLAGRPLEELETLSRMPRSIRVVLRNSADDGGSTPFLLSRGDAAKQGRLFSQCVSRLAEQGDAETLTTMLSLFAAPAPEEGRGSAASPAASSSGNTLVGCLGEVEGSTLVGCLGEVDVRKLVAQLLVATAKTIADASHQQHDDHRGSNHFQHCLTVLSCAQRFAAIYGRPPSGFMRYFSALADISVRREKVEAVERRLRGPRGATSLWEEHPTVLLATMSKEGARRALEQQQQQQHAPSPGTTPSAAIPAEPGAINAGADKKRRQLAVALVAGDVAMLAGTAEARRTTRRLLVPALSADLCRSSNDGFRMACELLRRPRLLKQLRVPLLHVVAVALAAAPVALTPQTSTQALAFAQVLQFLDTKRLPSVVAWITSQHLLPQTQWRQRGVGELRGGAVMNAATSLAVRKSIRSILHSLRVLICQGEGDQVRLASRCRLMDLLEACDARKGSAKQLLGSKRRHRQQSATSSPRLDLPTGDLALVAAATLDRGGAPFSRLRKLLVSLCHGDDVIVDFVRILCALERAMPSDASSNTAETPTELQADTAYENPKVETNPLMANRRLLLALWHLQSKHSADNLPLLGLRCRMVCLLLRRKYELRQPAMLAHFADAVRVLSTLHLCGGHFATCLRAFEPLLLLPAPAVGVALDGSSAASVVSAGSVAHRARRNRLLIESENGTGPLRVELPLQPQRGMEKGALA